MESHVSDQPWQFVERSTYRLFKFKVITAMPYINDVSCNIHFTNSAHWNIPVEMTSRWKLTGEYCISTSICRSYINIFVCDCPKSEAYTKYIVPMTARARVSCKAPQIHSFWSLTIFKHQRADVCGDSRFTAYRVHIICPYPCKDEHENIGHDRATSRRLRHCQCVRVYNELRHVCTYSCKDRSGWIN